MSGVQVRLRAPLPAEIPVLKRLMPAAFQNSKPKTWLIAVEEPSGRFLAGWAAFLLDAKQKSAGFFWRLDDARLGPRMMQRLQKGTLSQGARYLVSARMLSEGNPGCPFLKRSGFHSKAGLDLQAAPKRRKLSSPQNAGQ